jgi:hypothetical protein
MSNTITKTVDILYTYSTQDKSMSIEVDGLTTYFRIDGEIEASWPTASNDFIMNVLVKHNYEQNHA